MQQQIDDLRQHIFDHEGRLARIEASNYLLIALIVGILIKLFIG